MANDPDDSLFLGMIIRRLLRWGLINLVVGLGIVACTPSPDASSLDPDPPLSQDSAQATKSASPLVPRIDAVVKQQVEPDGPGVAVLVLMDNQVLYAKGYGLRDLKAKTPITPDTSFDLASVSKQMTAIAILKLMEQDKLELDAPVADYIPEFQNPDPNRPILIRQLLYHTSGLADYTGAAWEGTDQEFANLDLEAHLIWLNQQKPVHPPGTVLDYNNSGYALLALVVQRVSGQSFAQFMQTELFQPLGMVQSLVYSRLGQTVPNQATGYLVKDGQVKPSSLPSVIAGDGNIFSTLNDLARYDIALRQAQIVSPKTLALAFAPGTLSNGDPIEDEGQSYGMGWSIAKGYVHHSGSWMGASSYYRHYLTPKVSIVVLSNNEAAEVEALAEEIARILDLPEQK